MGGKKAETGSLPGLCVGNSATNSAQEEKDAQNNAQSEDIRW